LTFVIQYAKEFIQKELCQMCGLEDQWWWGDDDDDDVVLCLGQVRATIYNRK
jgi:hypothetical protein